MLACVLCLNNLSGQFVSMRLPPHDFVPANNEDCIRLFVNAHKVHYLLGNDKFSFVMLYQ